MHLRAGDERDGREIEFQQAGVLDDNAIHADVIQALDESLRGGQFFVGEQRVDGNVDARPVGVSISRQRLDIGQRIARRLARAKSPGAKVHGVSAGGDGRHTARQIFGWSEEFDGGHAGLHGSRPRRIRSGKM
ncbi:MAG: hypothetical protein BWY76_02597 [bacterium ADurb.Bin429]|nr:MAG: hypothetical protein BWY76_02597 [bacterium ADurb.Bin429]